MSAGRLFANAVAVAIIAAALAHAGLRAIDDARLPPPLLID